MTTLLRCGDAVEVLKTLDANSVDAVITDPPYGLTSKAVDIIDLIRNWHERKNQQENGKGFMNFSWDAQVPSPEVWEECYRILKPGGHLIAFFGARTYDLGVLSIRMAKFEIRDQVMWIYGKYWSSLNESKR